MLCFVLFCFLPLIA